jgi:hypothetical protein
LKEDLSIPPFIRTSKNNENFIISIMDLCLKTNIKERATIYEISNILDNSYNR